MDIFPRDIRLRANSASGDWVDVQEMIAGGSVSVSNAVGQPDEAKELLGLLVNRPARKVWGAAVRWALGIGNGNDIQLQLQALPCPASNLKKCPTLRGDNVPVMIITTFHVWCQLFDDPTAGTATPPPLLIGFRSPPYVKFEIAQLVEGMETCPSDQGSIPTLKQMPTTF